MENAQCIRCGKTDGLKTYSFLTVNVHTSSSTSGRTTRTTTTESLTGGASCAVCPDCIRKKRITHAICVALGSLAGVFVMVTLFGAFFLSKNYVNNHFGAIARFAICAAVVVAVIVLIVLLQKEDAFVAALVKKAADKKTNPAAASLNYVPVDASLYVNKKTGQPDLNTFISKTGLKTNLTGTLFLLILGGSAPAAAPAPAPAAPAAPAVTAAPAAPAKSAAPAAPAAPVLSKEELLEVSVSRLVALYKQNPDGFTKARAGEVRAVGEQLNSAGGMDLMLQAHRAFQAQNSRMARNLEIVWDGIGSWMG